MLSRPIESPPACSLRLQIFMFLGKLFLSMATVAAALFYLAGVFRPITVTQSASAAAAASAAQHVLLPLPLPLPLPSPSPTAHQSALTACAHCARCGRPRPRRIERHAVCAPRVRRVEFDACGLARRVRPTVQRWHG